MINYPPPHTTNPPQPQKKEAKTQQIVYTYPISSSSLPKPPFTLKTSPFSFESPVAVGESFSLLSLDIFAAKIPPTMKAETEKKLWFSLFLVVYLGIATLLLGDAVAVQQAHPEHSILVGTLMIISGILVAVYIYEDGEIPVLENRKYAKYCNLVGPVLLFLVVLSLDVRQPAGDCIYWALFFAPLGSFSLVMMLRPVSTDMGSFYPLCALSFTISLRDYHYSWRTWVAMAVSIFLMFTRAHMETRAIFAIAARKKALRDAVETSTADVADA